MKKFITITIMVFFISCNLLGQSKITPNGDGVNSWITSTKFYLDKKNTDVKPEGSPYMFNTFMLGKIIGINQDLMLRYNAFADEVEIQKTETENGAILKDLQFNIISMNFGKYKLRLLNYKNAKNEGVYGYLVEVFNANDFSLLRRDKIILENEKMPKTSFEPYYPAKFVKVKNEFYIEKKDKSVLPMPKNKKELEAVFPNQMGEIETFFKNKNYSFKEEQDLIEISKFIATL